jgi:hypothetical protein
MPEPDSERALQGLCFLIGVGCLGSGVWCEFGVGWGLIAFGALLILAAWTDRAKPPT